MNCKENHTKISIFLTFMFFVRKQYSTYLNSIKYKRPKCSKGARRQFYHFQHSAIGEHLTITLQFIITSRVHNHSLIVDAHNYCIEWFVIN